MGVELKASFQRGYNPFLLNKELSDQQFLHMNEYVHQMVDQSRNLNAFRRWTLENQNFLFSFSSIHHRAKQNYEYRKVENMFLVLVHYKKRMGQFYQHIHLEHFGNEIYIFDNY